MSRLDEYNRTWKNLNRVYSAYAKKIGMSDCEFLILYALYTVPETAQKELGDELAMPKQTVSAVLSSLGKRGLIKTVFEKGSKKSKTVSLTNKGRIEIAPLFEPVLDAEKTALNEIAEPDFESMIKSYDALKDKLENLLKLN